MRRVILVVLDGVGCGALPDAKEYGDEGANTLGNVAKERGGICLKHLEKMGLGNIISIKGVKRNFSPIGWYGKAKELSKGKDSTTGHWELMGVIVEKPFPTFPNGFPSSMLEKFVKHIPQKGVLGGYPASGTEIIQELGEKHVKTGFPIVYTSADSVFQIAAHKEVIPLKELYKLCEIARKLFPDICRIIARPFVGPHKGKFVRTKERKDYTLTPKGKTLLELLQKEKITTITIGKIDQLFSGRGISLSIPTKDNFEVMDKTLEILSTVKRGLIFSNFVDFDMVWGHRKDVEGFAKGLEEVDKWVGKLIGELKKEDLLIITADHGVDPTTEGTDHTREFIPIVGMGYNFLAGINIGVRESFADIGETIGEYLGVKLGKGRSFLSQIWKL
jgi:phosphopentomutase